MCGGGGDVFSDIGSAIEGAVESVGDVASSIGDVGTSIAQETQRVGQAIIDNPLPIIEAIAITAALGPEGLAIASEIWAPVVSNAAVAAINGGDVKQIATAAGSSYAGGQAGQYVGGATENPLLAKIANGATGGATSATIQGQSLAQGITRGAIRSGVGGAVSGAVGAGPDFSGVQDYTGTDYLGEDQPLYYDTEGRALTASEVAQLRPDLFPGGQLPGPDQETSYKDGKATYQDATSKEGILAKTLGTLAGRLATGLLAPAPATPQPRRAYSGAPATSTTTLGARTTGGGGGGGGGGTRTGTAALGQALRTSGGAEFGTGSTGGFGAGGESLSPETGGKQQNVWNIESLRVKPEES